MTKTVLSATSLEFKTLQDGRKDCIAILALHRPQAANSFNGEMLTEIKQHLKAVAENDDCRLMVLRGSGKNFCAGADLNWMKSFADLSHQENVKEALVMAEMYEALYHLPKPTIAVAQGAAYGGAVGLVAACDSAIAVNDARFCLSEVRVGLIPAVILPYVSRKMSAGQTRRHMISGRVFKADEALSYGLVEQTCSPADLPSVLKQEVDSWLAASPQAQSKVKQLYNELSDHSFEQSAKTAEAIASIRTSKSGQSGIRAFFNKQDPAWVLKTSDKGLLDD